MKKEAIVAVAVVGAFSALSAGDDNKTNLKPIGKIKDSKKEIKKQPIEKKEIKGFKKKELDKIFGLGKKDEGVASRSYGWDKVVPNR